jgi:aminoglycoside phosphotransferase family enzyme/predicted kinase
MHTEFEHDALPSEELLKSLLAAMMEPSFYPKRPSRVTHLETHISHVFLAGDFVYKIKKPVRFAFLDFSTLAKRKYFLHEELRLNRRLAPSVYLSVLPLTCDANGWHLGGDSKLLEYTLVMRRLPADRMLPFLLQHNLLTGSMVEAVADIVAPFHSQAPTGDDISVRGDPEVIKKMWDENLAEVVPFVGKHLDAGILDGLKEFGLRFLTEARDLLARRIREGKIREVHGDLHCEHVCFEPEGIQIFDCIEFSRELRCCDVASEVAFLMMDLEFRGAGELAKSFLRRYLELAPDPDLPRLLPFYKCYRAVVRGKVEGLQAEGKSEKARAYFELAYRATWEEFKPFLVLICGLSATGKSTLARRLAERVGATVISSDVTRKAIAGVSSRQTTAYTGGIYSRSMTERTYAKMMEDADQVIGSGQPVILDATFQKKSHRELARELASKHKIPLAVVVCDASEQTVRERLKRRAEQVTEPSDATWEVYRKQKEAFEKIDEIPGERHFTLDTESSLECQVYGVEQFLRKLYLSEAQAGKTS